MERGKESTARITVYNQFGVTHSYTLESTSFGVQNVHMSSQDFEKVGYDLGKVFVIFEGQKTYAKYLRLVDFPVESPGRSKEDNKVLCIKDLHSSEEFWKDYESRKANLTKMTMSVESRPRLMTKILPSKTPNRNEGKDKSRTIKNPSVVSIKQNIPSITPRFEFRRPNSLSEPMKKDYVEIISWINQPLNRYPSDKKMFDQRDGNRVMYLPKFGEISGIHSNLPAKSINFRRNNPAKIMLKKDN